MGEASIDGKIAADVVLNGSDVHERTGRLLFQGTSTDFITNEYRKNISTQKVTLGIIVTCAQLATHVVDLSETAPAPAPAPAPTLKVSKKAVLSRDGYKLIHHRRP